MSEIIKINGKRYRKLISLWNENLIEHKRTVDNKGNVTITPVIEKEIDICAYDKWVMIDGIEYEELEYRCSSDKTKEWGRVRNLKEVMPNALSK